MVLFLSTVHANNPIRLMIYTKWWSNFECAYSIGKQQVHVFLKIGFKQAFAGDIKWYCNFKKETTFCHAASCLIPAKLCDLATDIFICKILGMREFD